MPSDGQPAAADPPAHVTAPHRLPSGTKARCAFGAVSPSMQDPTQSALANCAPIRSPYRKRVGAPHSDIVVRTLAASVTLAATRVPERAVRRPLGGAAIQED